MFFLDVLDLSPTVEFPLTPSRIAIFTFQMRPSWPLSRHFQHIFLRFVVNFIDVIYRYNFRLRNRNFNFQTQPSLAQSPQINVYIFLYIPNATIMASMTLFRDIFVCSTTAFFVCSIYFVSILSPLFCSNFTISILFQFRHLNFVPILPIPKNTQFNNYVRNPCINYIKPG